MPTCPFLDEGSLGALRVIQNRQRGYEAWSMTCRVREEAIFDGNVIHLIGIEKKQQHSLTTRKISIHSF